MKALVFGFYKKNNIGDNFFVEAYKELFPEINFTFTDKITKELFLENNIIFFGGGSFLDGAPNIFDINKLIEKPIIYLGVGAETSINPAHKFLLERAKLVYIRSEKHLSKMIEINPKTFLCKDLVYSLFRKIKVVARKNKSILYIPNSHNVSKWNDISWKQVHWEGFKSEISQVFEKLSETGHSIDVLSMCENNKHRDLFSAIEIINKMNKGNVNILPYEEYNFSELSKTISSYEMVISQRYHGLIVADLTNTPCINIHHHDKLKEFSSENTRNIDYYGVNKLSILNCINISKKIAIFKDDFIDLKEKVNQIIKG